MNVNLFAGAGGWEAAMPRAFQWDTLGVEVDRDARATRGENGLHSATIGDVTGWTTPHIAGLAPRYDTLIASPPCTAFSAAGKGHGRDHTDQLCDAIRRHDWAFRPHDDPNVWLALEVGRWAEALEPRAVVCEQVPSVLPLWEAYCEVLRGWGYSAWCGVLSSERYGVPQTRKRAILIARRDAVAAPPAPTHQAYEPGVPAGASVECEPSMFGPGLRPWVSMAEALGWDERDACEPAPTITASIDNGNLRWTLRTGCGFYEDGQWVEVTRNADEPAVAVTGKAGGQWYFCRPATTVVGSFRPDIIAAPGYRTETSRQNAEGSVKITVAEAATLQSFPPGWKWCGSKTSQFRQIGNAIPPLLARAVLGAAGHPTEEES